MKKSEKVILIVTLSLAGLMLGAALVYAGWTNLGNYFADKERKESEQTAEYQRLADEKRAQMRAYWETPEGKAEAARKRQEEVKRQLMASAAAAQQQESERAAIGWQPSAWDGSVPAVEKWIEGQLGAVKYNSWQTSTNQWKVFTTVDFTSRLSREVLTFTVMKSTGKVDSVKRGGAVIWPE